MNKLLVTSALALIIAAPHPAITTREVAPTVMALPNPSAGLIQFVSKEGEFSVKLPAEPAPSSQDVDTAVGKVTMHSFLVETNSGNTAYAVMYGDYPVSTDPTSTIDGAIKGEVESFKGKIVSDKNVTLNGWPGRTVKIEGADMNFLSSVYLARNRLYQVIFGTGITDTIPSDAMEFLSSFEITRSAPPK